MPRAPTPRRPAWLACALVALACSAPDEGAVPPRAEATLRITVVESASGAPTPARVGILDERGVAHVPTGALRLAGECAGHATGEPTSASVLDPRSGAEQFYAVGPIEAVVPPGRYRVTAEKGIEYRRQTATVDVEAGERRPITLALQRWANAAASGWFSADDHVHIRRTDAAADAALLDVARAEDLHVLNVLQMGAYDGVAAAPQRAFGEASVRREGDRIVASGQENPRTWILGHAIVLGARSYLDDREHYLVYRDVWRRARAQGALTGYAHWRARGLLLDAPDRLVDFLEVLQFDVLDVATWYELLDLGVRLTPTAGTDFPCEPSGPPGAQRVYARLDGPLSWDAWLEAVRAGRTFVSNGPLLEFAVDGTLPGGDLRLKAPGEVHVLATVRFDPERDEVARLELIRDGAVVHAESEPAAAGVLRIDVVQRIETSGWLALRASGEKVGAREPAYGRPRASAAHTAAVFVSVAGAEPRIDRDAARRALDQLDDLERRVSPRALRAIRDPARIAAAGIDAATGLRDRDAVLAEIEAARPFYEARAAGR